MMDEYKAAGIVGAVFGFLMLVLVMVSCDDGPDLIDPAQPAAVAVGAGCAPPADAGADCTCPDGGDIVVLPGCGKLCGLE